LLSTSASLLVTQRIIDPAALYGILITQICTLQAIELNTHARNNQYTPKDTYYFSFPEDKLGIKLLVYGLFITETVQTGIIGHDTFVFLVQDWGNPIGFSTSKGNIWLTGPIMDGSSQSYLHII
jgi:hypothetical protein